MIISTITVITRSSSGVILNLRGEVSGSCSLSIFFKLLLTFLFCVCAVKKRPKLKSRYKSHVEATIEYAKMIDDFDHLVDLRTLARHCLGLEPSAYVLCAIEIEKNSKCSFGFVAVLNSLHFFFF